MRRFGRNGPNVSALAFGAMGIRNDSALAGGVSGSLLHALDHGVSLIDTARLYPESETIIGETLRAWRGQRPLVSSKVAPLSHDGFRFGGPLARSYTAENIRKSVDESLRALGVECLDIVHLHQWHYRWSHELEWLETLQRLQRDGKVGLIAISSQDHEHDALLEIVSRGAVSGVQVIVNLFESRPSNALLPRAAEQGVGVIARCILDSGGLAGELSDEDFKARPFLRHAPAEEYRRRVRALLEAFVPTAARNLSELAMRFVLSDPAVSTITLGMTSQAEVDAAQAAIAAGPLPDDVVTTIRQEHVWTKNFYERLL
jgi:aryl-alcohol dehydrogenase-like predicted oxidoreductase